MFLESLRKLKLMNHQQVSRDKSKKLSSKRKLLMVKSKKLPTKLNKKKSLETKVNLKQTKSSPQLQSEMLNQEKSRRRSSRLMLLENFKRKLLRGF